MMCWQLVNQERGERFWTNVAVFFFIRQYDSTSVNKSRLDMYSEVINQKPDNQIINCYRPHAITVEIVPVTTVISRTLSRSRGNTVKFIPFLR
jgi:hypothetical protein